ncbi:MULTISPECIES: hypothetical protein [Herbaspirillum]|uniref:hypothetical protein n=1 Tax=Herbaspirillum TaxID=963 RepID=UPI0002FA83EC|nr:MULTISPECIES: hypothetical protein [Herbaspirillum]AKN67812.1 hypothetical protein ACP92_22865 [Herbaspirillum seropedicae]AON56965.1 hypothetical protein Hsc_4710 [Herbaspirillum seropedicae]NQE29851.1 hypothetical protein [Herbaspirillum seropedicae]UMU23843.1 hypothetical protein G5B88_23235 [Herbaspirillum seropedicae]
MLHQLFSRSLSVYPRVYLQFAALVGLLIAAEFSLSTLSMMLTQRAVHRVSQGVRRRREVQRRQRDADTSGNCCA